MKKKSNFGENGQLNCYQINFMKRHKVWQRLLLSKKNHEHSKSERALCARFQCE